MRKGEPGSKRVPFPVVRKTLHGLSRPELHALTDDSPLQKVPMHLLRATQPSIDPKAQYYEPPIGHRNARGLLNDHPVVLKHDGQYDIYDGHHRLSAEKARGDSHARVRLVDLDTKASGLAMWARARE